MQCSSCRAENPSEARFCNQCGDRLDPGKEAEHRQLTVVFADLVGSTELAASLGPEDWRDTVRRFQAAAGECVARYEGTVAQYLGDGVLVYFGHPVAHEDDPERALRAGLGLLARVDVLNDELEREYGVRIGARLAAHTGPVVIGEMGGRMRTEQLALGEAPNVAARLQDLAPSGSIVTSAATLALVEGRFQIEELGVHELRGVREPMAVYRVVREAAAQSRFHGATGRSLSAYVGRAREVDALRAAFEGAAQGNRRLVWITGEPGIGKSRLLHELERGLGDTRHHWLDLRASAYAEHSAFEPFRVLLAHELGTDADAARARVAESGVAASAIAPALEALLGYAIVDAAKSSLPLGPERKRAATIASLGDWVLALAADRPVVLAVEDLHGIDPSSIEVLERIVERASGERILVAVTARSGTKAPDGWREISTSLELRALAPEEVATLIAGLAADATLSDDLRERIAQRSDGNPLFAEELVRSIATSSEAADGTAVPFALLNPLRARLDRTGAAQATAQLASALGREFSDALLRAVSPLDDATLSSHLAQLVDAELIVERPAATGASYQFRHALLRDVAYDSMLRRTRQARHSDIARTLLEGFGALVRARPDLLAHHHAAAGDHTKAATQWLRAAKRSTDACAYRELLAQVERGLQSLSHVPEAKLAMIELALQMYRGHAYTVLRGYSDSDALTAFQRVRELARAIDDPQGSCMALLGLHGAVILSGSAQESAELSDELLERAQASGDPALIKNAHLAAGLTEFLRADFPRSHEHLTAALGPARAGIEWYAESVHLRTTWLRGQPATALRLCEEYSDRVRDESALVRVEVLAGIGNTYLLAREYRRAIDYASEVERIARHEGMHLHLARAIGIVGAVRVGLGEVALGVEGIEEAYGMVRGTYGENYLGFLAPVRADAHLAAGDVARAIAMADLGLADESKRGCHFGEAELLRVKGEACARLPDLQDEAEALLRRAIQIAHLQGAPGWELRAALSASNFLHERGRGAEARALLAPCVAAITEGHDHVDPAAARALLDQLDPRSR